MRVRHVNLDAIRGHNGEKYERYFKKRIATIVSAYCERKTNECPGMALVLNPNGAPLRGRSRPSDAVLYAIDDDDPLLSQDNVILLRTHNEPHNITRILFNVVKGSTLTKGASLSDENILDPVKVKYILGSQPGPLARILGGVRVESVRVNNVYGGTGGDTFHRENIDKEKDNSKLMTMLFIVGTFFAICYAVGGYKLWSDCQKRKKKRKATETTQIVQKEEGKNANYGSMVTAQPNGSTVVSVMEQPSISISSPVMGHCYTRPSSSLDASTLPRPRLSDRQALLMFGCDPSQLPKEASIDTGLDEIVSSSIPPPPPPPSTLSHPLPPPSDSISPPSTSIPAVVLLSSHSLSRDSPLTDPLPPSSIDNEIVPLHRPKSRRGSRVDDG
ncbi:hypothetical protein PENTCL1PPCAC_11435 [Pristionchus entomophagus]|uniref:Uncharacterized protein n=1 Tax=Pristionchus entomophagus TaxID=358040 RepID=A0AAV5T2F8_9BILA|nr:hypothetical protein PENTCL1PPCAC_11435 [Pristionchus entomophagus]